MEQRFDGANIQYSSDNGNTWLDLGSYNEPANCLNDKWYNYSPITYLSTLSSARNGWSGNSQPTTGSCQGGNGSNGWVTAKHIIPALAGLSSVSFRFTFGAGTICNNYDGFAIDDITISEAPPNSAAFTHSCVNSNTIAFSSNPALCPIVYAWDFGDPASGTTNASSLKNPSHTFSGSGTYTVSLTVSGQGNAPSTITDQVTILSADVVVIAQADCITNNGGSAIVNVSGGPGNYAYLWNTTPPQTTAIATGLSSGGYSVIVNIQGACPDTADVTIPIDFSCIGVYFPSAFTPNGDGINDSFGPLGSLSALTKYSFSIYNRWGQKVFSSVNPFEKWDGALRGKMGNSSIFVWYAEYELPGQGKVLRKGTISLIK
jgi:gliding motility-associated-like protein